MPIAEYEARWLGSRLGYPTRVDVGFSSVTDRSTIQITATAPPFVLGGWICDRRPQPAKC
jgi:hypothetical protein